MDGLGHRPASFRMMPLPGPAEDARGDNRSCATEQALGEKGASADGQKHHAAAQCDRAQRDGDTGAQQASAQLFVPGGQRVLGTVNFQSTMSMSVPADATQNPAEQIELAQKAFYAMAGRQCSLVLETVGESCQITNLNNNSDLSRGNGSFITVRGTVTMAVKLKGQADKP